MEASRLEYDNPYGIEPAAGARQSDGRAGEVAAEARQRARQRVRRYKQQLRKRQAGATGRRASTGRG